MSAATDSLASPALAGSASATRRWLFNDLFPLWIERGVDWSRGGFYEKLDLHSLENAADFKRLRVTARQIYTFSEAALMGWSDGRRAVDHGLEFLFSRLRRPSGGYAVRADLNGVVTDESHDLYDTAFVLFCLAAAYRLTKDRSLRDEALSVTAFIQTTLKHPTVGFLEGHPVPSSPRRQNPHMHLFEAAMAWVDVEPDCDAFTALAATLFELFQTHFFDPEQGVVREYFDDKMGRLDDPLGRSVEAGHSFEWVWLLRQWERQTRSRAAQADVLYENGRKFCVSPRTGAVIEEIWVDGAPKNEGCRLWAQTERLKADLAQLEQGPTEARLAVAQKSVAIMSRYWDEAPVRGACRERLGADGTWSNEPALASSLYHVVLACSELLRVSSLIEDRVPTV